MLEESVILRHLEEVFADLKHAHHLFDSILTKDEVACLRTYFLMSNFMARRAKAMRAPIRIIEPSVHEHYVAGESIKTKFQNGWLAIGSTENRISLYEHLNFLDISMPPDAPEFIAMTKDPEYKDIIVRLEQKITEKIFDAEFCLLWGAANRSYAILTSIAAWEKVSLDIKDIKSTRKNVLQEHLYAYFIHQSVEKGHTYEAAKELLIDLLEGYLADIKVAEHSFEYQLCRSLLTDKEPLSTYKEISRKDVKRIWDKEEVPHNFFNFINR